MTDTESLMVTYGPEHNGPHERREESKLELESNLSEILSVNCKFFSDSTKIKSRFKRKKKDINTDEKFLHH